MAYYHFTMKTDKQNNGNSTKSIEHINYITRQEKYSTIDFKEALAKQEFTGNALGLEGAKTGRIHYLYRSLYGSIRLNGHRMEVSDHCTPETLYIAMELAKEKHLSPLTVFGSVKFNAQVIRATVDMEESIQFSNAYLTQQVNQLRKDRAYENDAQRKNIRVVNFGDYNRTGVVTKSSGTLTGPGTFTRTGNDGRSRDTGRATIYQPNATANINDRPKENATGSTELHALSERYVADASEQSDLLVLRHAWHELAERDSRQYPIMRRHVYDRKIIFDARNIAKKILTIRNAQIKAGAHADYIDRQSQFANRGGCIFTNHHLPTWANNSPQKFFAAADGYERANACCYREIEFALPNELNLEQQKEIIETFLDHHLNDFYYAYAIHDKVGVMSNDKHNTHVHIMFSDREIDDQERRQERSAKDFFSRATTKKDGTKTGCAKAEKFNGKTRSTYLGIMRKDFAEIQNAILQKYGYDVTVDHRSLKEQREEALSNGDILLAELLDRIPEEHLGPKIAKDKNHPKVIELQKYREYKKEHAALLTTAELIQSSIRKDTTDAAMQNNMAKISTLTHSADYQAVLKTKTADAARIQTLKEDMLSTLKNIQTYKSLIVWNGDAAKTVQAEYLYAPEKVLYHELNNLESQKQHWLTFRASLLKSDRTSENLDAYNALDAELQNKLAALDQDIKIAAKAIEPAFRRIAANKKIAPAIKSKMIALLASNKPVKADLEKANQHLADITNEMEAIVKNYILDATQAANTKGISAYACHQVLSNAFLNKKKQYEQNKTAMEKLKVISIPRAELMAKDVFTNQGFKKIREEKRLAEKENQRIAKAMQDYMLQKEKFEQAVKPLVEQVEETIAYNQQSQSLEQEKMRLNQRVQTHKECMADLDARLQQLIERCSSTEGKEKIQEIARGILSKNQPIAERHEKLKQMNQTIERELKDLAVNIYAAKKQVYYDQKHGPARYKAVGNITAASSPQSLCTLIASAIRGEPHAAQAVARTCSKEDRFLDWTMMDQMEREAAQEKIAYHLE
jgi:hypothetical protein